MPGGYLYPKKCLTIALISGDIEHESFEKTSFAT